MDERVAIVTGGGAGLGRELVFGLVGAGFAVVVADIDGAAAEETAREAERRAGAETWDAAEVRDAAHEPDAARMQDAAPAQDPARSRDRARGPDRGRRVVAVRADVREVAQAREVVRVAEGLGGPHVLVNNAGGWTTGDKQFPAAAPEEWAATLALNLSAPMLLTQLVLGPMRDLGGGAIVNIASSAARGDEAYGSPEYAAAKAGLIRLTTSLRGLDASHGVRVLTAVPHWIGLDRAKEQLAADPAAAATLIPPAVVVKTVLDLIASGQAGTVVDL